MVVHKIRQLLFCAKYVEAQEVVYICSKACHMYSEMLLSDVGVYTAQHTYFKHKYHVGDLTQKFHP